MSHQRRAYVVGCQFESRRMLTQHVGSIGVEAWPFASGSEFLQIVPHLAPGCVLLDMDTSDVSGLEILHAMARQEIEWPVVAVCAREEFQLAIEAMKLGALDFLRLPVKRETLALALAPAWDALQRVSAAAEARRSAQERLDRLTARELEVLLALLGGLSNKVIAHEFGISVRTVEMHRAHLMGKLDVKSLAEAAFLTTRARGDLLPLNDGPRGGDGSLRAGNGHGDAPAGASSPPAARAS